MVEVDFWKRLETRVSREFAGLPERRFQYFWCDGFLPDEYLLDGSSPRLVGRCWIGNGHDMWEWDFVLHLPSPVRTRDEIDWASLLPAENVTRWMALSEQKRFLEIEPAVAVPDLSAPQ